MFRCADLMLITKVDLLPYVNFDLNQCMQYAARINPHIETLSLSAVHGQGLNEWYEWLKKKQLEMNRHSLP